MFVNALNFDPGESLEQIMRSRRRDRLADGLELVEHVPRGSLGNPEQDLVVLRRRSASLTSS